MKKKRKLKKKVVVLLVLIIVLILSVTGLVLYKTMCDKSSNQEKVVGEIPEYGYTLEANQPKIYKDLFKKLVTVLNSNEVDYDKYAELISQMYAIDFYNLDNKQSKNDVGGIEFVYKDKVENFAFQASDTVYKYVENNFDNKRTQKLPIVTRVELTEMKNEKYKYKNINDDNAYVATIKITYKEDLGYPTDLTVKLLRNDKKLEVYYME